LGLARIWLTGSQVRNKLFCWYCVLFSVNKNPYNSVGYDNLKEIHRALVQHEISKEHTDSAMKFKLFGKQNIANAIAVIKNILKNTMKRSGKIEKWLNV
jgi:hypothetical protein